MPGYAPSFLGAVNRPLATGSLEVHTPYNLILGGVCCNLDISLVAMAILKFCV